MKRVFSLILCLCIVFLVIPFSCKTEAANTNDKSVIDESMGNIETVINKSENTIAEKVTVFDGELLLNTETKKDFSFQCTEGSFYIQVKYVHTEGKGINVKLSFSMNGQDAIKSSLSRVYKDGGTISQDNLGNDIRPTQVEVYEARTIWIYQEDFNSMPHVFHAKSGENVMSTMLEGEGVKILNITAVPVFAYPTYDKYCETVNGFEDKAESVQIFEAENANRKSDQMIYPTYDRTSSATSPSDPTSLKLNTIGGIKWQQNGQWIEWKMDVKQSGFYKIGIRARQAVNSGQYSSRRLLVNGSVPFINYNNLKFPYSSKFDMYQLGGENCAVYLEKGENKIELQIMLGDMEEVIGNIKETLLSMNACYREILSLTGSSPDTNRDYNFREEIPETIKALETSSNELSKQLEIIINDVGGEGSYTSCFRTLISVLNKMYGDPDKIPGLFQDFEDNIAALGTWVTNAYEQPLEVDYIALVPLNNEFPNANSGFIEGTISPSRNFLVVLPETIRALVQETITL